MAGEGFWALGPSGVTCNYDHPMGLGWRTRALCESLLNPEPWLRVMCTGGQDWGQAGPEGEEAGQGQ